MQGITLDHVAVALERWEDGFPLFAVELGGVWKSGGFAVGFAPGQIAYANGMKVELLEPHQVEENDFLRRFLDRHGPGPHHYTFKVESLDHMLDAAAAAGLTPVGVDRSDPEWHEAFLHPNDTGLGIVIQLAQVFGPEWKSPAPTAFPSPTAQRRQASLLRVVHRVTDVAAATRIFGELLGATAHEQFELAWPGPGRIRLVRGDKPGIDHLVFSTSDSEPRRIERDDIVGTAVVIEGAR
jgi:hypothetical protein